MARHAVQCLGLPHPVLQHLRGGLHEVPLHTGAGKHRELCLRAQLVHHVAELVEEGLDVAVREQRGLLRGGLGEVADHGRHRHLPLAAVLARRLQAEAGGVAVLAVARVHVHVEVAHGALRVRVRDLERLHLLVPRGLLQLGVALELQAEQLLVDAEQPLRHDLEREVLLQQLVVHVVPRLLDALAVVGTIPSVDLAVGRISVALLHLPHLVEVAAEQWLELLRQLSQEGLDFARASTHANGGHEICVCLEAHQLCLLVPELHELL
mmetsp:Transcript_34009/g.108133  ORF Transcript_34009/g.108133 Transcript_34009/m.108133 type:complete len:266 (-) Transcript_34009:865-1662(-)